MNAEIVAVGSELLTPQRIDTNSLYLTEQLNGLGVEVVAKSVVGDDRERLTATVKAALARSEIVILTGGLGPTEDDVTRDAVATALDRRQVFRQEILEAIEQRFRRLDRKMAEINRRQAFVLEGAEALRNDHGTAPGQWMEESGRVVMLLPGPPNEMKPMFAEGCLPRLRKMLPAQVIRTRVLRVAGMPESDVDQRISPVYTKYQNPVTTILAAPGDIQVHLRARCRSEAEAESLLEEVAAQIEPILGDRIYSRDGSPLEVVIGALLRARSGTLSVAESCTGGLLAERITSIAGSSDYFVGGFLVYTDRMKGELLGLDEQLLRQHTAVSEPVAAAMAAAAKQRTGSTFAVSITGVAGPSGGTQESPVGTVFIGVAGPAGCRAHHFRFLGDRGRVRTLAAQTALDLLRRELGGSLTAEAQRAQR
jgi:nicotinamide-nucleotide amidase